MKNVFLCIILMKFSLVVMAREKGNSFPVSSFARKYQTSDRLYWNDSTYLMDQSMLCNFQGYQNIFPQIPMIEVCGSIPFMQEKNYYLNWILWKGTVYMAQVDAYGIKNEEQRKELVKKVEKLVGKKFVPNRRIKTEKDFLLENGIMPATWVNGVFYIKKLDRPRGEGWWEYYQAILIEKGQLKSIRNIGENPRELKILLDSTSQLPRKQQMHL